MYEALTVINSVVIFGFIVGIMVDNRRLRKNATAHRMHINKQIHFEDMQHTRIKLTRPKNEKILDSSKNSAKASGKRIDIKDLKEINKALTPKHISVKKAS